jgi:tetratricopeptide (TPR) repeat protein
MWQKLNGYKKTVLEGRWPYFWMVTAILITYIQAVFFDYTNGDDYVMILANQGFIGNIHNFFRTFITDPFMAYNRISAFIYRPLLISSFILDAWVGGTEPWIYHTTNILLHIGASLILFVLLRENYINSSGALAASLLFAVHPALVQAVVWIPGRNDTLLALFILASFWSYLRCLRTGSRIWYLIHMALFSLALFTKETAIFFPFVCLTHLLAVDRRKTKVVDLSLLLLGWLAMGAVWYYLRQSLAFSLPPIRNTVVLSPVRDVLWGFLVYFGKTIFPLKLSGYSYLYDASPWYGVAALTTVVAVTWFARPRNLRIYLFGLFWFLMFLVPLLVVGAGQPVEYEHRLYLPLAGGAIAFTTFWDSVRSRKEVKALMMVLAIGLFMVRANLYSNRYFNDLSFWRHAVKSSPSYSMAYNSLAVIYSNRGEYVKSEQLLLKALEIRPGSDIYCNLAVLYSRFSFDREAEFYYRQALRILPYRADAHFGLGYLYYKQKKYRQAAIEYQKAVLYDPNFWQARKNLVLTKKMVGKSEFGKK